MQTYCNLLGNSEARGRVMSELEKQVLRALCREYWWVCGSPLSLLVVLYAESVNHHLLLGLSTFVFGWITGMAVRRLWSERWEKGSER